MSRPPIVDIPGSLDPWAATDFLVMPTGVVGTVSQVFVRVIQAPSGGSVVLSLRNATGGGGDGIDVTIADGTTSATATGSVALSGAEALYLRVVSASGGAVELGGWFLLDESAVGVAALTTLARVKQHANISPANTDDDALINNMIAGISGLMQKWMCCPIVQTAATGEKINGSGRTALRLNHYPVFATPAPVLYDVVGTVIPATEYELDFDAGIAYRIASGGAVSKWDRGIRNFSADYTHGYATVPEVLVMAATEEVRHKLLNAEAIGVVGQNRIGDQGKDAATGGQINYEPKELLKSTIEAMSAFRKVA